MILFYYDWQGILHLSNNYRQAFVSLAISILTKVNWEFCDIFDKRGTIWQLRMHLPKFWRWWTTLNSGMPSSPSDIHQICLYSLEHGLGINDFFFFFTSICLLHCDQLCLHLSSNECFWFGFQIINGVKQCTTCQHTNYHDTTNYSGYFNYSLSYFDHKMYVPQTSTYCQNIAKLLTHTCISFVQKTCVSSCSRQKGLVNTDLSKGARSVMDTAVINGYCDTSSNHGWVYLNFT